MGDKVNIHSTTTTMMKILCLFVGLTVHLVLASPLSLKCAIEHVKVCNGENQDNHHHENEKESKIICETEHVKHCETEHKLKCSQKFGKKICKKVPEEHCEEVHVMHGEKHCEEVPKKECKLVEVEKE